MRRHSTFKNNVVSIAAVTLIFLLENGLFADDQSVAVSQIRVLGGSIRESKQGLEIGLHLRGRTSANRALKYVAKLDNVVWLHLGNSNVTDEQLVHLKNLSSLRWLHLEKTSVTDSGLKHLAGLKNLEYLNLYSTAVTDASVGVILEFPKLRKLYVWQSKISTKGLEKLRKAAPSIKVVSGIDLSQLENSFAAEAKEPKPKLTLDFVNVERRDEAPVRSDNGVNCQLWFENAGAVPIKVYWIGYGAGQLKYYFTLKPKEVRKQNTYSRNAWLITDEKEKPLGYFVAKDDDARAIVPKE